MAPRFLGALVGDSPWHFIPLVILPMLFAQISALGIAYQRSSMKSKAFALANCLIFLSSTAVILTLLIPYQMGIRANLWGLMAGSLVSFGIYLALSIRYSLLGWCFSWGVLKKSLVYSLPLLPVIAGSWVASLSDRLILAYYGKIAEVGLYSISAAISRLLYFVNDAVTRVQQPLCFSALTEDRERGKKQISEFSRSLYLVPGAGLSCHGIFFKGTFIFTC